MTAAKPWYSEGTIDERIEWVQKRIDIGSPPISYFRELLAVIDGQREEIYQAKIVVAESTLAAGQVAEQVFELRSALAESYAPCRECGGPPGILMDCTRPPRYSYACLDRTCPNYCDTDCKSSEAHPEARAAWNEVNRSEQK